MHFSKHVAAISCFTTRPRTPTAIVRGNAKDGRWIGVAVLKHAALAVQYLTRLEVERAKTLSSGKTDENQTRMMMADSRLRHGIASRRWRRWLTRFFTLAFFAVVAYLLITHARSIEWGEVIAAMRRRSWEALSVAVLLTAGSYALYSCFDLLGRYATRHSLRIRQVLTVTFISYAFNLNFGALVGGIAFRYRLYSRLGLGAATVTQVALQSMLTNWLGYLLVAGLVFWWWPISLPPGWKLAPLGLRILGFVLFAVVIAYLVLCAVARRRSWAIGGNRISLPSLRLALLQLCMSSANWLLIAGVVFTLLEKNVAFPEVLGVLLAAAIAGVIMHVPAGLGVLEAVFVALLSHRLHISELLAALLTYRAVYYLAPLVIAALTYLVFEVRVKRAENPAQLPDKQE